MVFALVLSGVYAVNAHLFDVGIILLMGFFGYMMRWFGVPYLPLVLGVVLGHHVESSFRRSMVMSAGDVSIFFSDVLSVIFLSFAFLLVFGSFIAELRKKRARPL